MRFLFILICIPFLLFSYADKEDSSQDRYDIIIKNGIIIDGTGNPWFKADIFIKAGKITKIGRYGSETALKIIDGRGLIVSPGFIDVHTHTDRKIAKYPKVLNYLLQGVTTVVGGNCGGHKYPLKEFFKKLEKKGIALNFASLIGHNTVRKKIMGRGNRQPTKAELNKMRMIVDQEMLAGAVGLSTGLSYVPGRYSKVEEIIELVKMIAPYKGIYATHMRNQGIKINAAILESIRIGSEAGVPVQISHIKLAREEVWGNYDLVTAPIEAARKRFVQVYMDQYPYTATSSGFTSSFPGWSVAGGHKKFVERLKDPELYKKIKKYVIFRRLSSVSGIDRLDKVYVSLNNNHPEYEGKNLAQILDLLNKPKTISNAADLLIKIQKEDRARGIFFQMNNKDVKYFMSRPYNMIASDGKIEIPGIETPHPRAYGTFPRVLAEYVRKEGVIGLEEAIQKMTSLPAQVMGFFDRGILRTGMAADIVIFDPDKIKDMATFSKPHQYPQGIKWVIVNGKTAACENKIIESKAGKILYGNGRKLNKKKFINDYKN